QIGRIVVGAGPGDRSDDIHWLAGHKRETYFCPMAEHLLVFPKKSFLHVLNGLLGCLYGPQYGNVDVSTFLDDEFASQFGSLDKQGISTLLDAFLPGDLQDDQLYLVANGQDRRMVVGHGRSFENCKTADDQ